MEYHVLSNSEIVKIIFYSCFVATALGLTFLLFAQRNASPTNTKKSSFNKIIKQLILCILISHIGLFIIECFDYPWFAEPQPSEASMYRQIRELGVDSSIVIWGWANDYQFDLLKRLSEVVLWICWTVYAFHFRPSDIPLWKKICKIIAYIIFSSFILSFSFHTFSDLLSWIPLFIPVIILLWIARVKPKKESEPNESTKEDSRPTSKVSTEPDNTQGKDTSTFMPKVKIDDEITATLSSLKHVEPKAEKEDLQTKQPIFEEVSCDENLLSNDINKIDEPHLIFCKYCGKRIESDSAFCQYCGKKL